MISTVLHIAKTLLFSLLFALVCLSVLCLLAYFTEEPEAWISSAGRASLFFGALMAGFFGARGKRHPLTGLIACALYLCFLLLCAFWIPTTHTPETKWILLCIGIVCGAVGALIGGRYRTKTVRRKKRPAKRQHSL